MNQKILISVGIISIIVFLFSTYLSSYNNTIKEGLDTPSPESLIRIPNTGIPDGYYKYNESYIAPIPYGYYASTDKSQIFPKTIANKYADIGSKELDKTMAMDGKIVLPTSDTKNMVDLSKNKYSNDLTSIMNIEYHQSDKELMKLNDGMDVSFGQTVIYDSSGNRYAYPTTQIQGDIVYYTPGSYSFGTSNYVPNYADMISLSKTTGIATTTPFRPENKSIGFCNYNKNSLNNDIIEKSCRALNKDTCATTDCCVLLGGSTCIAGNEYGPSLKANYGDIFIRNKDYYYYRGKCYGNCS
jgi:hypothetical protein